MKIIQAGFHLIELLVTLAIVVILAGVGILRYTHYVTNANRLQAEQLLGKLAIALEQYQIENNSYAEANLERLHFSAGTAAKYCRFTLQTTDSYYLLKAQPIDSQEARDRVCGSLTLDANGAKGANDQQCW